MLLVGVDGGGTKTHVIVAEADGTERASAEGTGSAVAPGKAERSADAIAETIEAALSSERLHDARVAIVVAGLAGVGRDEERRAVEQALAARGMADEIRILPDAEIALADAFGDDAGILVIAGTGSIAYGRNQTGEMARCGGWGPTFGDEGSGTWLGRRALGIVAAAADGREAATALTGAILTAAQVNEPHELIPWAAAAGNAAIAALAPVVFNTAQTDPRANALVDLAVEELVLHVRALARQLFGDDRAAFSVALAGGLLSRSSMLRTKLEHRLKSSVPGAHIRSEDVVPARGAVRLAMRTLAVRSAAVVSS